MKEIKPDELKNARFKIQMLFKNNTKILADDLILSGRDQFDVFSQTFYQNWEAGNSG